MPIESLTYYLPPHEGLLPKWLLLVSVISIGNSIQAYNTLHYTARVYSGSAILPGSKTPLNPVTALSARTFGTWTFLSSVIRLYAAYYIDNSAVYQLALWTYVVAFGHFVSEWLYFGTARWGKGLAGPVAVSTGSLVWMYLQWGWYVS